MPYFGVIETFYVSQRLRYYEVNLVDSVNILGLHGRMKQK